MMEAVRTSETSVNFNVTTRCYIPEDSKLHTRRRENLKSRVIILRSEINKIIWATTEHKERNYRTVNQLQRRRGRAELDQFQCTNHSAAPTATPATWSHRKESARTAATVWQLLAASARPEDTRKQHSKSYFFSPAFYLISLPPLFLVFPFSMSVYCTLLWYNFRGPCKYFVTHIYGYSLLSSHLLSTNVKVKITSLSLSSASSFSFCYQLGTQGPFSGSLWSHIKSGLLWTSDQPVAEASTCTGQHNI
jgi:hypothetical protein